MEHFILGKQVSKQASQNIPAQKKESISRLDLSKIVALKDQPNTYSGQRSYSNTNHKQPYEQQLDQTNLADASALTHVIKQANEHNQIVGEGFPYTTTEQGITMLSDEYINNIL